MKPLKATFFLICVMVAMVGCLGNTGSEPAVITDPSATTHLYITNQSSADFNVTYKTSDEYVGLDSTVTVPVDTKTLIFEPGGFSFPTPSEAFAKLSFYNAASDPASPILIIEPVIDTDWNDITAESDTVKKYELIITEDDIK